MPTTIETMNSTVTNELLFVFDDGKTLSNPVFAFNGHGQLTTDEIFDLGNTTGEFVIHVLTGKVPLDAAKHLTFPFVNYCSRNGYGLTVHYQVSRHTKFKNKFYVPDAQTLMVYVHCVLGAHEMDYQAEKMIFSEYGYDGYPYAVVRTDNSAAKGYTVKTYVVNEDVFTPKA